MLKRWWRYFLALFSTDIDKVEDPEVLLSQAQREMEEMHARNRKRAVQAITQKNNLQQMVDDTQKRVDNTQAKIERAREQGDEVLAEQLIHEKAGYEETLTLTRRNLAQAVETVDRIKAEIKRQEEAIRAKTAEALALKAQWKKSSDRRRPLASPRGRSAQSAPAVRPESCPAHCRCRADSVAAGRFACRAAVIALTPGFFKSPLPRTSGREGDCGLANPGFARYHLVTEKVPVTLRIFASSRCGFSLPSCEAGATIGIGSPLPQREAPRQTECGGGGFKSAIVRAGAFLV